MFMRLAMGAALAASSVGALAQTQPQLFKVSIRASSADERIQAQPNVVLRDGSSARIRVAGTDGYDLTLRVASHNADRARLSATLKSRLGTSVPDETVPLDRWTPVNVNGMKFSVLVSKTAN